MRQHFVSSLVLTISLTAAAYAADNWADSAGDDKAYAASKAACVKSRTVKLPAITGTAPKDCDSSSLLAGTDRPADPVAARACAAREMADDGDNPTGGAATLATIYANGSGVPRNYDVAIAYACQINGAPAEIDGRVNHLVRLKASGPEAKPFDICDDATSGAMEGFCSEREGDLANAKRKVELAGIASKLDGPARTAFDRLLKAEQTFVKSSADNEVDVSGTARGMLIVQSQQAHEEAFMATLRAVLSGKVAAAGNAGAADGLLNAAYAKVMAMKDTSGLGTVEKKGIKETQRIWLSYRNAFVAFAKLAARDVATDALMAALTEARTKDLEALGS